MGIRFGIRNYYNEVLVDNPVAYWRLGEPNGDSIAIDEKGTYNGTYIGSPQGGVVGALADGNTAVSFPGGTSFTTTPHVDTGSTMATIFTGNNPRSFECWFNPGATLTNGAMLAKSNNAGGIGVLVWVFRVTSAGKVEFVVSSSPADYWLVSTTATVLAVNTWAHLAAVVSNVGTRDAKIYINGVATATTAVSGGTPPTTWATAATNVWIGKSHNAAAASAPAGKFDEVAIYSSALSAARILAHYQASARR